MICLSCVYRRTQTSHTAEYDVLRNSQACAGVISTNAAATAFWLDDAQQAVLANEHGSDASPLFMGGARPADDSPQHQTHTAADICAHIQHRNDELRSSCMSSTGLFQHIPELMACQPKLLDAFRSGQGFTYDDMGSTNVCATCRYVTSAV
jgi:hypothetical protein